MYICFNIFSFRPCAGLFVSIMNLKPALILFSSFVVQMAKQFYACNWVPSRVTEEQLDRFVATGVLAKKEVIHWRVPGPKNPPEPNDREVIVFVNPARFKVLP